MFRRLLRHPQEEIYLKLKTIFTALIVVIPICCIELLRIYNFSQTFLESQNACTFILDISTICFNE